MSVKKVFVELVVVSIMNGLPDEGLAGDGPNLSCKFLISALDQNMYTLKLVARKMSEFNSIWPNDHAEPVVNIPETLAPEFEIPIKFESRNGAVGKIYVPEALSDLLLKIYRGFLSILHLTVKKKHVYDLKEAGIKGVCRTLYSVNEDLRAERIFVTQTRDMNHCQERIYTDMGLNDSKVESRLIFCRQKSKSLRGSTSYNYVLKQVPRGIMILEANVNELIQFSPLSERYGAAQTESRETMVFHLCWVSSSWMKYEFSNEFEWTPLQQTEELLNLLVTHNAVKVRSCSSEVFGIDSAFTSGRYEDLEAFWSMRGLIPPTGMSASVRFIKEKFQAEDLSVTEAIRTLFAAVHMVTANPESIKLFETANSTPTQFFLGYGTMISKYCAESDVCPVEYINDKTPILLLLKANSEARHHLPQINHKECAHSRHYCCIEAIMALRNIAKKEPRMVQELALQLYMDKTLDPELRMLSCIFLFETNPSMALISTLANAVKSEENLQVASFTYSHMKSLSRSASMIHPSVAAACNVAMKILSPKLDRLSLRYSKAVYGEAYSSSLMVGAAATAFYINDAATFLPRSVVAKTKAFFVGAAAVVVEIGMRTDGLQETLLKTPSISDSADRITKMKHVIKLSQWRSLSNNKPLGPCYVKLFGQEIASASIDKPMIEWAIEVVPSVQIYDIKALKTVLLSGVSFNYAMPVMFTEVRRITPTSSGVSLELSFYSAAVVKVKPTLSPRLPEDFPLYRLLKTDLELQTEITPSFAMDTYAVMGTNSPLYHAFIMSIVKFNSNLPSKISVKLDIKEGDFKIDALPVSSPENFPTGSAESFAVIRNILDPTSGKVTSILPYKIMQSISSHIFQKKYYFFGEVRLVSQQNFLNYIFRNHSTGKCQTQGSTQRYFPKYRAIGLKACFKVATENAGFIHDTPINYHFFICLVEGEKVERLEMEVKVGAKAAEKILKQINWKDKTVTVLSNSSSSSSAKHSSKFSSSSSSSASHRSNSGSSSINSCSSSRRNRLSSSRSFSNSSRSSSASSLASLFSDSCQTLGVTMTEGLSWSPHTASVVGKTQQRLYYLRKLKTAKISRQLIVNFYNCAISRVLTSGFLVWFHSCTKADQQRLQWVGKTAGKIIGTTLPEMSSLYTIRCLKRVHNILHDQHHPTHHLFHLLPLGRRYRYIKAKTTRLRNSLYPQAVRLLNSPSQ
uniref:Vitellogenin domain-containing protein n=1 Tax=Oryzias latipes TaxID=8090 RepID=A0A3P9JJT9_ORYLA